MGADNDSTGSNGFASHSARTLLWLGLFLAVPYAHPSLRRLRVFTRVSDRPGGLAALLLCVASAGGNLLAVEHVREAVDLQVRQTGVELTLETRGSEHAEAIIAAMMADGYEVERV